MKAIANEQHEPQSKPRGGWAAALLEEESDAEAPDGPESSQVEKHHAAQTQQPAANSEKEELAKTVMVQTMMMQQLQTQMQQTALAQVAAAQANNIRNNMPMGPSPGGGGSARVPEANLQRTKQYQTLMSHQDRGRNEETVFVGGLRKSTEENQVFSHFSKFGELESVDIKRTPDGTSRGFAFVKFKHKDGVDRALEQKASHMIDNKWLAVRRRDDQSAHAGRAASIAKAAAPKPVEEAPPPEPEDREEDFTAKYLTMAQQLGMAQEQEQQVVGIVGTPVMMMAPMMSPMMGSPMMGGGMGQPMMGSAMGSSVRMEPYRSAR